MVPDEENRKVTGVGSGRDGAVGDKAWVVVIEARSRMGTIKEALSAGWKAFQSGDLAGAEQIYRQAVRQDPSLAEAWYMLGAVNQLQGRTDEAVADYREAIRLLPDFPEACNNLGVALHAQKRSEESVAALRRALALKPDYAEAHNNLGNALHERGELDEAVACYRRAVAFRPNYPEAYNNLGNALRNQGRLAEAMESYEQALALKPDHADVHLSRALAWLGMGDFERGLPEYEWRFRCSQFTMPQFRQPLWDGSPLDGRTIVLYADHGLGDAIQFIRYVPMVRDRGGRVIVVCARPLARLLSSCPGIDRVVVEGEGTADCDVYAPLMSLPRIFGTTLATIPADVPYLFPDPALVEHWRGEMNLTDELPGGHHLAGQSSLRPGSISIIPPGPVRGDRACRGNPAHQPAKGLWERADRRTCGTIRGDRPRQQHGRLDGHGGRDGEPRSGHLCRFRTGPPGRQRSEYRSGSRSRSPPTGDG